VAEGDANGGAYEVAKKVNAKYAQYETRVTVLGHIQRGGSPSAWDRVLASRLGVAAVEGLIAGETNSMAGLVNDQIKYTPLETSISMKFQLNKEELRIAKILSI
jgi:6-phosphofructokinase 1